MITALGKEEHDFKTLIIDSVTQLDTILTAEILAGEENPNANMAQACGGYGGGYSALSDKHRKVREWAGKLNSAKDMHIIFIAHTLVKTIDLPNVDPFMRYTIALHDKSVKHYIDNVDVVAHTRQKILTRKGTKDKGPSKAIDTQEREIVCHLTASNICKNRLGIDEALPFNKGENPFSDYL